MNVPTPQPPGSPEALDQGCQCSFLLNDPEQPTQFVNPLCPLHGAQHEGRANAS